MVSLAWGSGCQAYEPRPLAPELHRAAWHARVPGELSIRSFLERFEAAGAESAAPFDVSDGLTLAEGQCVALMFHPRLRVARLRAGRAAAGAENAGRWADPQLNVTALRIAGSVAEPWFVSPGVGLTLPTSGRLGAQRDVASAERRAEERRVAELEWAVWVETRVAWARWSAALVRIEETERFVARLEVLVESAEQLAESGELPRTEAALFALERAQRENQLRRLRGEALAEEQRLRSHVGLAPEAPVRLLPSLAAGGTARAETSAELARRNPGLARLQEEYAVAEARLRGEIRKQFPDLTLGPLYESDAGQSRIGFFGGLPLPLWNANRRGIAEARVEREIARAAFETEYELLVGRWAAAAARNESFSEQRTDMETNLVPLLDRQLEDALRLTRLGEASSLVLLESLTRAQQAKLDLIDARLAEVLARAELELLIGPPATTADEARGDRQETP